MIIQSLKNYRIHSIAGFSLFSAYLLSFLFEGQVLCGILAHHHVSNSTYILLAILAHFAGLISCGLFVKSQKMAKYTMLGSMGLCLLVTLPFFFSPDYLWLVALLVGGYCSGLAIASWGYFLKAFTTKNERFKTCADVLIFSNMAMIAVNITAVNLSPLTGLSLALLCLVGGMTFIGIIPAGENDAQQETMGGQPHIDRQHKSTDRGFIGLEGIIKPLLLLCLFIFLITINSGLMYEVINPAFDHLVGLVSWYWAVPYIIALATVRNLPLAANRSKILYLAMAMIMGAFISFMLLGRGTFDYLLVDTLMLGACGIFDLFWWSIIGEMLDHTKNPAKVFGIGLSANVFGVLAGGTLGMTITSIQLPSSEVAVIALTIVCITLVMLPPLNRQLVVLLKNHIYLAAFDQMSATEQTDVIWQTKTLEKLTAREEEVLQEILLGKTNRQIATSLFISESTVKTHARNIYSKYDVTSRAELISTLLKNQS